MRALRRPGLEEERAEWLAKWTGNLCGIADRSDRYTEATDRWSKRRGTKAMTHVVERLKEMNGVLGTHCMYCEFNEARQIDHFEPRQRAPERTFDWSNLYLACEMCNGPKLAEFLEPETDLRPVEPTDSYDPPHLHLRILPSGTMNVLTERGRWTRTLFNLDRDPINTQRRDRWAVLAAFIPLWHAHLVAGRVSEAQNAEDLIRNPPCVSVLRDLLIAAQHPDADLLGLADVRRVIEAAPQILTWSP